MRGRHAAALLTTLFVSVACADKEPGVELALPAIELFRPPPIPNVIDGVVWEAGNWEPHLAAGAEGVSWGNHRAVVELEEVSVGAAEVGGNEVGNDAVGNAETGAISVQRPNAVFVTIPWRRRDADPGAKGIIVVDATSGEVVPNALALRIENTSGDVIFQPNPGSSVYHVYYLPWQSSGGYYPTITYPNRAELLAASREPGGVILGEAESPSRAQEAGEASISWVGLAPNPDPAWETGVMSSASANLPRARTTRIQSVDDFHSFFPMEVIATPEETDSFWEAHGRAGHGPPGSDAGIEGGSQGWAVVPEYRDFPIRMRHFIPRHWAERATASLSPANSEAPGETSTEASSEAQMGAPSWEGLGTFSSPVLQNEEFTFQLGIVSGSEPLDDLRVSFDGFPDSWLDAFTCFNCGGINEKGLPFTKRINVSAETVQPIWIGVRVPADSLPEQVDGTVTVISGNRGSRSVFVSLDVLDESAVGGGADEPELQTRLSWLNSTVGTDPDFIIEPFQPVTVERDTAAAASGTTLGILGREVELGPMGLPSQIYSYFTPELTELADEPEPILAQPLELRVVTPGVHVEEFLPSPFEVRQEARGRVEWTAKSTSDYLDMTVHGALEYDGMLDLRITLVATSDAAIDDIGLPVTLVPDAAEYMLGLGRKGGKRPGGLYWKWAVENHQEGVWLGGVHKGLQYVLRDENYVRPLNTNFYRNQPLNMPPSWYNEGRGGIQIFEEREPGDPDGPDQPLISVTADNYSGPRQVLAGDTLHFNIRFLITPFKPINTNQHFNTRFVHQYVPVDSVRDWGGTVVNIHHANQINPYINYPFFNLEQQGAYIDEAHQKGIKVKLYNTIRELTYKAYELFPMRSLGDEILNDGEGGGHSWMQEHLEADYHSAWHAARTDDAAMLNKGTSRWTNYYVEGVNWLAANQEIDGLYLDDIAFSRETVKRLVTVLEKNRPEVVIDLHSANQFNVRDGFTNSAMLYMEHFPFISRLWFGEYFEYDLDQDYWMTEVAGLPFGLMGEMLQDGGHPYRGLLYGMTGRKYGGNDPRPVWAMMDDFGIADSRMLGYWLEDTPVTADRDGILATTYLGSEAVLIVLASWSGQDEIVNLSVNWEELGFGTGFNLPDSATADGDELGEPAPARPQVRAYAPAVEGIQEGAELDLAAVPVPAGQGLFVVVERLPGSGEGG